jgi:hypothetical protein
MLPKVTRLVVTPHTITEAQIKSCILGLLSERSVAKTICPSEVARRLAPSQNGDDSLWRALMPRVREVAFELAAAGLLEVTQGGMAQDLASGPPRGAIRLRARQRQKE